MLDEQGNYHIYTRGVMQDNYPDILASQLADMPPDTKKIIHHIDSPGGDCKAGYSAYHLLLDLNKPIHTIVEGSAESMATFMALAGNTVDMKNPGCWMIHMPFLPQGVAGDSDVQQAAADNLRNIQNEMATRYAAKTGKPIDEMLALMKKTTNMTAYQAKKMGFVDNVIEPSRAAGFGEELVKDVKNFIMDFKSMFGKQAAQANAIPVAVDYPLQTGGVINVDNLAAGGKATIDGKPAEGVYELENGKILTCAGGVIADIKDAQAPPSPPPPGMESKDVLQQQLAAIQSKIAAMEAADQQRVNATQMAEQIAAKEKELATLKAEAEKKTTALALAEAKIKELEGAPAGDQNDVNTGLEPNRAAAIGGKFKMNNAIAGMRTFIAQHTPGHIRYLKGGKYADGTSFYDYMPGGALAVSILETNFNYTWDGILDKDLFYKPTLGTPALGDLATIDTGAAFNKRYHLVPTVQKVLKPYTGCDQAVTGTRIQLTSKEIQLKKHALYESWCQDDFTGYLTGIYNVLAQDWLKTGNEGMDPGGTPIDRIIMDALKDALRRDVFRRAMFADISSSSADWNQIDGMITNIIKDSGAANYCVYRAGSALGIASLSGSPTAAFDAMKAAYNNSSRLLKQEAIDSGRAIFWVTRSIWENYYDYLVGVGSVSNDQYDNFLKGINTLTYKGIPVKPVTFWDECLNDSTCPLFATTRHLVLLTLKENHIIGVQNTADLGAIDSWFEKKDQKRYYRSNMTFGYQKINCDLTTIVY